MSEIEKSSGSKSDEIDLLDLFARMGRGIGSGIRAIGAGILHVIFFLVRKWLWVGLSLALGIGISYLIKFSTERQYSSDITFRSNAVDNSDMIAYINKLHTFCRERNLKELASSLSVDSSKVEDIIDIQAFWVIDLGNDDIPDYVDFKNRHNVQDTVNVRMQDRFVVRVRTSVPQEMTSIRDGIISFVGMNSFFVQQNELRLTQNEIIRSRLDYEIDQLDSLQKVKYFEEARRLMPKEGGQMIFLQEQRTQLLHDDIINLFSRRQYIERELTLFAEPITLLSDYTPPARPDNGALFYGKVLIPLIFFITVFLLLLIDNRDKLIDTYRKY
jgi:hypothetical protein